MHEIRIYPDFKKLSDYYPTTDERKIKTAKSQGIKLRLNYSDEENPFVAREEYQMDLNLPKEKLINFLENVNVVLETHRLTEHYNEIVLITLMANENLIYDYDLYWDFYEEDLKAKEVAKFLLAYKNADANNPFQLVIREKIGRTIESSAVKDPEIAKWMCELILQAIEKQPFHLGILGERITGHLGLDGKNRISYANLKKTSELSLKTPKVLLQKLMVQLCLELVPYLNNYTHLVTPNKVIMGNRQAEFFFDLLESLQYINSERIDSFPRDYIHAMFKNYVS